MYAHTQYSYIHASQTSAGYKCMYVHGMNYIQLTTHTYTAPTYVRISIDSSIHYCRTYVRIVYTWTEMLVQCTFSLCEKTLMAWETESVQTTHNRHAMRTIPQRSHVLHTCVPLKMTVYDVRSVGKRERLCSWTRNYHRGTLNDSRCVSTFNQTTHTATISEWLTCIRSCEFTKWRIQRLRVLKSGWDCCGLALLFFLDFTISSNSATSHRDTFTVSLNSGISADSRWGAGWISLRWTTRLHLSKIPFTRQVPHLCACGDRRWWSSVCTIHSTVMKCNMHICSHKPNTFHNTIAHKMQQLV